MPTATGRGEEKVEVSASEMNLSKAGSIFSAAFWNLSKACRVLSKAE